MKDELPNCKTEKESLEISKEQRWQRALDSFAQLYEIQDPIRLEYELVQSARWCDLPLDIYRRIFEIYCHAKSEVQSKPLFLRTKKLADSLIQPLEYIAKLSAISLLVGVITYVAEIPKRAEQQATQQKLAHYQAWQIINASEGKAYSGGRIDALQDLNKDGVSLAGLNVKGAILTGINLKSANLSYANLSDIKLEIGNLSGSSFFGANLSGAYFAYTDLSNADFSYANLRKAILAQGTNLSNAKLEEADLRGSHLASPNLENANLDSANLKGASLAGANLTGANLEYANLSGANLHNVNLTKANLKEINLEKAVYDRKTQFPEGFNPAQYKAYLVSPGVDLRGVDLTAANLAVINLINANLAGANLTAANLYHANLKGVNLTNANLRDTNLEEASGLTPNQVKKAKNWEKAKYDEDFRKQLGLSPKSK